MTPSRPLRTPLPGLAVALLAVLALTSTAACRSTRPAGPEAGPAEAEAPPTAPGDGGAARDAEDYRNTVRWSTASELENFGFDVYRSESEDGPFERVNPEIIEGGGTTDEPRHYEFVDTSIDPHKAYFYYVESISMSGVRERFTPVGEVAAKIQGSSEPSPGPAPGGPDSSPRRRR